MLRLTQGILLCAVIVALIAGSLAIADAGSASHCSFSSSLQWLGCLLGTYEGLAGGLIGAGGALFAGWLAWTGVRDQVQAERELSTAGARAAHRAILIEMRGLFDILNEVWRAIDLAFVQDQPIEQRRYRVALANSLLMSLPEEKPLKDLRDFTDVLAKEMEPGKRGQFIRLWQSIDWVYREKAGTGVVPDNDDGRYRLNLIRINLSHFERYLCAFDEGAAKEFESRTKDDVDHRGRAAQIRPLIDDAEKGKGAVVRAMPRQP